MREKVKEKKKALHTGEGGKGDPTRGGFEHK